MRADLDAIPRNTSPSLPPHRQHHSADRAPMMQAPSYHSCRFFRVINHAMLEYPVPLFWPSGYKRIRSRTRKVH